MYIIFQENASHDIISKTLAIASLPQYINYGIQVYSSGACQGLMYPKIYFFFQNRWVRSWNCGCLVTWFCCQLIAKPGNKTATVSWPYPDYAELGHCQTHGTLLAYGPWTTGYISTLHIALQCIVVSNHPKGLHTLPFLGPILQTEYELIIQTSLNIVLLLREKYLSDQVVIMHKLSCCGICKNHELLR